MEYTIGFIIAVFIALTGVGAGTITTPLLILFLGVPASVAVSTGLMFSAAVKLVLVPSQIAHATRPGGEPRQGRAAWLRTRAEVAQPMQSPPLRLCRRRGAVRGQSQCEDRRVVL